MGLLYEKCIRNSKKVKEIDQITPIKERSHCIKTGDYLNGGT